MNKTIIALLATIATLVICLTLSVIIVIDKKDIKKGGNTTSQFVFGNELKIVLSEIECEYTGEEIKPEYRILLDNKELDEGSYVVEYINNTDIGNAQMVVSTEAYKTTADFSIIPPTIRYIGEFSSTSSQIEFSWENFDKAQCCIIYRFDTEKNLWTEIGRVESPDHFYVDKGLLPGTEYNYSAVNLVDIDGETFVGRMCDGFVLMTAPEKPDKVVLLLDKDGGYYLSWDAAHGAAGYEVYQVEKNGISNLVCDTDTTKIRLALTDIENIDFRVRAYCTQGDNKIYSEYSDDPTGISDNSTVNTDSENSAGETDKASDSKVDDENKNAEKEQEGNSKQIYVENVLQNPELPTGCEVTALTTLLNYMGYGADKLTLARNYLPKLDFYWENDIYYGADFRTTFAGDPENENSYGCYAPCIETTANSYLSSVGANMYAHNISGTSFETLLNEYIDNDIPVLIWITSSNLHETSLTSVWTTPAGETVQWVAYEHCVVLTGYDMDSQTIYVSDPLVGNTSYDLSKIRRRYIDMGQQSVWIG